MQMLQERRRVSQRKTKQNKNQRAVQGSAGGNYSSWSLDRVMQIFNSWKAKDEF